MALVSQKRATSKAGSADVVLSCFDLPAPRTCVIRLVWSPAANLSVLVENVALARDNTQDQDNAHHLLSLHSLHSA